MSRARDLSNLANQNALSVDSSSFDVGISSSSPDSDLNVGGTIKMDGPSGVITATSYVGAVTGNVTGDATGLTGTPSITVQDIIAVGATFSGVINYEDVTQVDSVGIVTARAGVRVLAGGIQAVGLYTGFNAAGVATFASDIRGSGNFNAAGITTLTGHVSTGTTVGAGASIYFPDNKGINFGNAAEGDMQIYHDSSDNHSYIREGGTGNLVVQAAHIHFESHAGDETLATFTDDGGVDLYFNDSKKLETTNTGIVVTGICTADTLVGRHPAVTTVTKSSQYTLADGDQGKMIITDSEVIVPENIFSAGDVFTVCNSSGSSINITKGSGINLYTIGTATNTTVSLAQKGIAVITCFAGNDFIVGGGGVS